MLSGFPASSTELNNLYVLQITCLWYCVTATENRPKQAVPNIHKHKTLMEEQTRLTATAVIPATQEADAVQVSRWLHSEFKGDLRRTQKEKNTRDTAQWQRTFLAYIRPWVQTPIRHAFFRSGSLFPSSPPKSTPHTHTWRQTETWRSWRDNNGDSGIKHNRLERNRELLTPVNTEQATKGKAKGSCKQDTSTPVV